MDELILTTVYEHDVMDILPPEPTSCPEGTKAYCDCCGRPATMDEDCCGICEECLSP